MSGPPPVAAAAAASASGGGGNSSGGGGRGGGGGRRGRPRGGGRGGGGGSNKDAADNKPKSNSNNSNNNKGGQAGSGQAPDGQQQPQQGNKQQPSRRGGGGGGGGGGGKKGGASNNKGSGGGGGSGNRQQQQGTSTTTAVATGGPLVISEEEQKLRNEEKQREEQAKAEKKRLEEMEKAKKAAARVRHKQQEEVSKRVKEANELIQAVVETTIMHKKSRAALQPEALAAARLEFETNKKKLISDFKKCTAFVKKIKSGSLHKQSEADIIKDVAVLNLSRYVEEVVAALLESKPKITDLPAIVALCKAMYERYPEFLPNLLLPQLWSVINSSSSSSGNKADAIETIKLRRIYLRLLTEFVSCGLVTDTKPLLKTIAEATGAPSSSSSKGAGGSSGDYAVQDANLVVAFTKQAGFEILGGIPKTIREAMVYIRQEHEKRVQFEQNNTSSSADDADASTTSTTTAITEPVLASKHLLAAGMLHVDQMDAILQERAVPPEVVEVFSQHCRGAFRTLSTTLVQTHNGLLKLEKRCEQDRLLSGTLTEAREKGLVDARKLKDSLQKSVEALSDVLNRPVPHLAEAEDDADQKEGLGIEVLTKGGGEGGENDFGPFDDEETRAFYCDIPDFLTTIPPAALGLSVEATEAKREENLKKYGSDTVEPEIEEGETTDDDEMAATLTEEELEKGAEPEQGEDAATSGEKGAGESENKDTPHYNLMVLLEQELPECHRREQIDEIAEKFCIKHGSNKNSRKRLAKTLFLVPHARLDLLPYYSRMTATLDRIWSDIAAMLVTDLEQQFHGQAKFKKNQNMEGRMRTARYIGELTKFRVAPPIIFLRCLRRCLDDFTGCNVDVACCLLETCGRYLYRLKHTNSRLNILMEAMSRLSKAKNLDERLQSLIKGAFYSVKPPPSGPRKLAKEYPPLEAYIRHLLMVRLDPSDEMVAFASRQLARCPWSDPSKQCGPLVCRIMLKACRKGRYKTIQAVAAVASSLRSHRSAGEVPIRVVDAVLEELRWALEHPNFRDQQRTITYARLLGELFCRSQVSANVIIEQLYEFINLGHTIPDALREASKKLVESQVQSAAEEKGDHVPVYNSAGGISQTIAEDESVEEPELETREETEKAQEPKPVAVSQHSKFDPRVISQTDPPNAAYRIKLVCTLLEVTAKQLVTRSNLPRLKGFLAAFQRYLFTKTMLPTDVEFSLLDTFDVIDSQWRKLSKPSTSRSESAEDKDVGFPRYSSWIEAHNATVAIEESEATLEQQKRSHLEALADHSGSSAEPVNPLARQALEDDYVSRIEEDDDDSLAKGSVEDESNEDEIDPDADGTVDDGEDDHDVDEEEEDDDDVSDDAAVVEDDEDVEGEFDEQAYLRQLEEEAFERELRRVQMEALEKGKNASRKIVAGDMISGSQIVKKKPIDSKFPSDSGSQDEPVNALSGKAGIRFQLLKKGNKGKVEAKELVVPTDTNLAMAATRKDDAAAREHREIKQRVLQYSADSAEAELTGGNVYLEHERLQVIRNKPLLMDDIDRNFGTTRGDLQSGQAKSANPQGVPGAGRTGGRGAAAIPPRSAFGSGRTAGRGGGRGRGRGNTGGRTLFGT